MKNVVMLGRQGSGKGTQAKLLSEKFSIPTISTGQLFRLEMKKETELGKQISGHMGNGDLVSDELVERVVFERIKNQDAQHGFILDGFPRSLKQAKDLSDWLNNTSQGLTDVIYIDISEQEAIRRLGGRRVCSNLVCGINYHLEFNPPEGDPDHCDQCGSLLVQRNDDQPESIHRRLSLYDSETVPLIDYYQKQGLLREINGEQKIFNVHEDVLTALN